MQYQVFVQSRADGVFAAAVVGVPQCVAEGATPEEALAKVTTALRAELATGKLFTIELEATAATVLPNPWLELHGSLRDDPTFDDFQAEVARARQELEAEDRRS